VLDRCIGSGLVLVKETLDMLCTYVLVLVIQREAVARGHTTPVQRHARLRPLDLEVFGRRRRSRSGRHLGRSGNSFGCWEREVRVNAGFGELGRLGSRRGPASKMLLTASQSGEEYSNRCGGRFNRGNDAVVEQSVATVWRVRSATGELGGSTMEYRVSGWMDSWCKRWAMGGQEHSVIATPAENN
jgi:hypothetical protein